MVVVDDEQYFLCSTHHCEAGKGLLCKRNRGGPQGPALYISLVVGSDSDTGAGTGDGDGDGDGEQSVVQDKKKGSPKKRRRGKGKKQKIANKKQDTDEDGRKSRDKTSACEICTEEDIPSDSFMECAAGHRMCVLCFVKYFEGRVGDDAADDFTKCATDGCLKGYDRDRMLSELPQSVVRHWDTNRITGYGREVNSFCPNPVCGTPFEKDDPHNDGGSQSCNACGHNFCLRCMLPVHAGFLCKEMKERASQAQKEENELKGMPEAERTAFKKSYDEMYRIGFRKCPGCVGLRIDKREWVGVEDGCNLLTCRRCGTAFCAVCAVDCEKWADTHLGPADVANDTKGRDRRLHAHLDYCDNARLPHRCTKPNCSHCPFNGPRPGDRENIAIPCVLM